MKLAKRLWRDESGTVGSAEVMLMMTILCIGMLVGIKSIRDSTITEFADMGQALSNLDQSYSYSPNAAVAIVAGGPVGSSSFTDSADFCDDNSGDTDTGFSGSKCVNVCIAAESE